MLVLMLHGLKELYCIGCRELFVFIYISEMVAYMKRKMFCLKLPFINYIAVCFFYCKIDYIFAKLLIEFVHLNCRWVEN